METLRRSLKRLVQCYAVALVALFLVISTSSWARDWGDGWDGVYARMGIHRPQPFSLFFQDYYWYEQGSSIVLAPWGALRCRCEPRVAQFAITLYDANQRPSYSSGKAALLGLTARCRNWAEGKYLLTTSEGSNRARVERVWPAAPDTTIWLDSKTMHILRSEAGLESPRVSNNAPLGALITLPGLGSCGCRALNYIEIVDDIGPIHTNCSPQGLSYYGVWEFRELAGTKTLCEDSVRQQYILYLPDKGNKACIRRRTSQMIDGTRVVRFSQDFEVLLDETTAQQLRSLVR